MGGRSKRSGELSGKRKRHHAEPAEVAISRAQSDRAVPASDLRDSLEAVDELPSPSKRIKPLRAKASLLHFCHAVIKLYSAVWTDYYLKLFC